MTTSGKHRHWQSRSRPNSGSAGFSLFELVVFIISVAIIYAYAANRFAEFPAQAERANVIAVLTQLQSGINLELMFGANGAIMQDPSLFEGINPMDLMLSPPTNYLGAFDTVDVERLSRRSWYFDRNRRELVYLVNDAGSVFLDINGALVPTDTLRFRVSAVNRKYDPATGLDAAISNRTNEMNGEGLGERFAGVLLQPVIPYTWGPGDANDLVTSSLVTGTE